MKSALIIGGGFAGCAAAHQLELIGSWDVTLVEAAPFLGAGNRAKWFGGHPYTFGPRHFLTTYQETFAYLDPIIPIRKCPEHEFLTYVEHDNAFYAFPINMVDVRKLPDYPDINREMEKSVVKSFEVLVRQRTSRSTGSARLNLLLSSASYRKQHLRPSILGYRRCSRSNQDLTFIILPKRSYS